MDDAWIGATYRSDPGWSLLERLVDVGSRMAGTDGEAAGARLVAAALGQIDATDVWTESFTLTGWERESSVLTVDGADHACIALPRSPATTAHGPLVDVGYGRPTDFEAADLDGGIAMVRSDVPSHHDRYIHRREKYFRAVDAGAIGFIYRNHVDGQLPPTGSVGGSDTPIGPVPAVGVSAEVGTRLARRHAGAETTLRVDATIEDAESTNVHARLGPETDERVLITAHHDAHDIAEGARDNGAGCALVVEIARMLAAIEDDLETGVRVVTFGAEEVGLRGSRHHVEGGDLDRVRAVVNCDAVGSSRDLGVFTNGFDGLSEPFEAAAEEVGAPVRVREEIEAHSDHWPFVRQGIPGVMAYSAENSDDRGWGHSHGDTFDKLDRRDLRELAVPLASAVLRVATGEPPAQHVEPAEIERRAEEEGNVLEDPE